MTRCPLVIGWLLMACGLLAHGMPPAISSSDRALLARLVLAEAEGEGELGMAAVARSVLNRAAVIRRGLPPGTYNARSGSLRDVIYAPGQYEPVRNGSLDRQRSAADLARAQQAIDLALDSEGLWSELSAATSPQAADDILQATGFRARSAFHDPSQSHRRRTLLNHVFNGDTFSTKRDVEADFDATWRNTLSGRNRGAAGALGGALGRAERAAPASTSARGTTAPAATSSSSLPAPRTPLARAIAGGKVVRRGDSGPEVKELQRRIGVQDTGQFGPTTEELLERWQRENQVAPTGEVGPTTLERLQALTEPLAAPRRKSPTAYRRGKNLGAIQVVAIDGKQVAVDTARAYLRMRDAARRDGVTLRVNSGFRSHAEQTALYRAYLGGTGNLAAVPGHSNHQSGQAVDIDVVSDATYRWLNANAARFGFRRTVPSEPWHWEYLP